MPIYEYICTKCGERFSLLQTMSASSETKCPHCKSKDVRKLISSFACGAGSFSGSTGGFSGGG